MPSWTGDVHSFFAVGVTHARAARARGVAARVAEVLPPAAAVWLERGRRAVDPRVS
jgi:hypothetical protein